MGLPRGRADGRPRPVLAAARAAPSWSTARVPALVLRATRGPRRRVRARRQRDRRRRLGAGPPDPRRHARGASRASRSRSAIPSAMRPWQHVLNPLSGYLVLAQALWDAARARRRRGTSAPPTATRGRSRWIVERLDELWPSGARAGSSDAGAHPHEAQLPEARLLEGPRAARLGAALGLDEALASIVELVRGAARRRRHARATLGADRRLPGRRPTAGARR